MTTFNNELYHFGIPGMRWGKRKSKIERVDTRSKKRGWSDDATEVAKIKTKKVKQMSNEELKTAKKRGELERDYKNLNPSKVKKGLIIAGSTAAAMGTVIALYNNGGTIIKIGKNVGSKALEKIGNHVVKGINLKF